jgi:DNA-directed RNA polymerase specialized sigma24 family protein
MKMDTEMDRRLLNWARHLLSLQAGAGGYSSASMGERVDGQGWDAPTVIPTSAAEADETHVAVMALASELRAAVESWYLGAGGVAQKCKRLCVSETTLRQRIGLAHRALGQWFADKALMARQQRERVEALQRAAAVGR